MRTILFFALLISNLSFSQNLIIEAEKDATLFPIGFSGDHSVFIKKTAFNINFSIHALVLNNVTLEKNYITIHNQSEQQGKGFINIHKHTFVTDKGIFSVIEKLDKTNDTKTIELVNYDLIGKAKGNVNFPLKRYKNKEYSPDKYRYSLSDDKSKLAIITEMKYSKGVQELINVTMIDLNSMTLLFDNEYTLSSTFQKYDFNEIKTVNSGNLILKHWDDNTQKNAISFISKENITSKEMTINSIVEGQFFENENSISYIGFETKGTRNVCSIVKLNINPTTGEFTQNILPFTEGKLNDFLVQNNLLNYDKRYGNYLKLSYKTIIRNNDDSYFLICEDNQRDQEVVTLADNKTSFQYTFRTNSSIIIKLNKSGDLAWATKSNGKTVIKNQTNQANIYQGNHYYFDKKGELHIIHNTSDDVFIAEDGGKQFRKDLFNNAIFGLFDNTIDLEGVPLKETYPFGEPRTDIVDSRFVFTNESMINNNDYLVFLLYHTETKDYKIKVLKK